MGKRYSVRNFVLSCIPKEGATTKQIANSSGKRHVIDMLNNLIEDGYLTYEDLPRISGKNAGRLYFRTKKELQHNMRSDKPLMAAKMRDFTKKNPELIKDYSLKRKYGITLADYNLMAKQQNHKCAICAKKTPGGKRKYWAVDHCHVTGKIRGLLCISCNTCIGNLGDNSEGLYRAYAYLKRAEDGAVESVEEHY